MTSRFPLVKSNNLKLEIFEHFQGTKTRPFAGRFHRGNQSVVFFVSKKWAKTVVFCWSECDVCSNSQQNSFNCWSENLAASSSQYFCCWNPKGWCFFGNPNIIHEKHPERKIQVWYFHLHFTHKLSQSKCTACRQTHSSPMLCGKVCLSDLSILHPAYFITTDHSIIVHIHLSPFQGWWIEMGRVPTVIR